MMSKKLRIAFAGTPDFALPSLENLAADSDIEIVHVFTQPDRPVGRGQKIAEPPIKTLAKKFDLPLTQEKLTAKHFPSDVDFLAVVAFGQILPSDVLELPKFGSVNLHASLLPKLRGASPIQSAILQGFEKTGVSFQKISEKLDAGDVFASFEIALGKENSIELAEKLSQLGGEKFPEVLKKIASGEISAIPQNESEATHCSKIQKADGRVDWEQDSAEVLVRKLRAFKPWPGVWSEFEGKVVKLRELGTWNLERGTGDAKQPGEVFESDGKILVKTMDGAIELRRIQIEGKQEMDVGDFVRGERGFVGCRLS